MNKRVYVDLGGGEIEVKGEHFSHHAGILTVYAGVDQPVAIFREWHHVRLIEVED